LTWSFLCAACLIEATILQVGWDVPNPFQGRRHREPSGRNRWLAQSEAELLLQAARESDRAPHLLGFIRLGLNTRILRANLRLSQVQVAEEACIAAAARPCPYPGSV